MSILLKYERDDLLNFYELFKVVRHLAHSNDILLKCIPDHTNFVQPAMLWQLDHPYIYIENTCLRYFVVPKPEYPGVAKLGCMPLMPGPFKCNGWPPALTANTCPDQTTFFLSLKQIMENIWIELAFKYRLQLKYSKACLERLHGNEWPFSLKCHIFMAGPQHFNIF